MLQTQALTLVSGNSYARSGTRYGVGYRLRPLTIGQDEWLPSKLGNLLAVLLLYILSG